MTHKLMFSQDEMNGIQNNYKNITGEKNSAGKDELFFLAIMNESNLRTGIKLQISVVSFKTYDNITKTLLNLLIVCISKI